MLTNIKEKIKPLENDLILGVIIVSVGLIGFGLGRLSKIKAAKTPVTIENTANTATALVGGEDGNLPVGDKTLVASRNGSKYHYVWCSGASSIKAENKIYFRSKEEAEKAGYQPASNCKGL